MKIETILKSVKRWKPEKILTQPDEVYDSLKEGEIVVDFNDTLMMSYDGQGSWQVSYGDWIGDYENPMPIIDLIMRGYLKPEYVEGQIQLLMADDEDKTNDCVAAMENAVEQDCLRRNHQSGLEQIQA